MRKRLKKSMAIVLSLAVAISGTIMVEPKADVVEAAEKYELVWSDEFDGDTLNRNNWNVEVNSYGGWNDELQYYCDSPENIAVNNGTLKITALKKTYEDKEYTSARLNTQNKVSVHFGKIEARMKLPSFKGAWPAFWMLGANGKMWPACGEIDILETVNDESIVYGTAHWENPNSGNAENYESSGSSTLAAGAQIDITQWHTYGIEWDAEKIVWYVDDIKYFVLDIASDPNRASLALEQYIILNLAVGGEWPGFNIDDTALPATMEVDYVRAYKLNENVTTTTEKKDALDTYQGTWNSTIGSWAGATGTVTPMNPVKNGFVANITAVGTDEWGVQTSLPSIEYVSGDSYTFRCTLISDIDKTVFVKVEGDDNKEIAAEYITLKANQPYPYEKIVDIPDTYNGEVSLFFAYGGGANGETIASDAALNLTVSNVEFYSGAEVDGEEPTTEKTTTEEKNEEVTTETKTEDVTTENKTEEVSTEEQKIEKPGKANIKKINRISKNRKAKLVLKKIKGATGYQIKYSTSKKFAKKKTKTIHTKSIKVTLKKLNANKKYYVKVRAYKVVDGEKLYGTWSTKKVIKVKK